MAREVHEEDIYVRMHEVQFFVCFFFLNKGKGIIQDRGATTIVSLNNFSLENSFRSRWFAGLLAVFYFYAGDNSKKSILIPKPRVST